MNSEVKDKDEEIKELDARADDLLKTFDESVLHKDELETKLRKVNGAKKKQDKELNELRETIGKLETQIKELKESSNAGEKKSEDLETKLNELHEQLKEKEAEKEKLQTTLDTTKTDLETKLQTSKLLFLSINLIWQHKLKSLRKQNKNTKKLSKSIKRDSNAHQV